MVNIVTGRINSGKTTRIIKIFETLHKGDGFVSIKHMIGDRVHSYDMMQLSNRQKQLLVLREDFLPDDWVEGCRIGPYSFSQITLNDVEYKIREFVNNEKFPVFLDEIGPLELQGKCFHRIFQMLVQEAKEVYVTVREDILDAVIEKYQLIEGQYRILK